MKKRIGWKAMMAVVAVVALASVWGIAPAAACSFMPGDYVSWPLDDARGVPLNATMVVNCLSDDCTGMSIRLLELPGRVEQPLEPVEGRAGVYAPTAELKAGTAYEIEVNGGEENAQVTTFTTGSAADHEAPAIAPEGIEVEIEYAEEESEFSSWAPGACSESDIRFDSIPEDDWDDYGYNGTSLPEHYHVVIQTPGLEDAAGANGTSIALTGIDAAGDESDLGSSFGGYLPIDRIQDVARGEVRTYRLRFEDILGNAKAETIDVVVTFDGAASTFSVKETADDDDDDNDDSPASAAAAGCSLDPQAKASGGVWAIGAMLLVACALLVRRARLARTAAVVVAALVLAAALAGCSSGTEAGAGGEANADCASYGGTLSSGYVCTGITEESCASLDGKWWTTIDGGGDPYCELPASDGGTACTDWDECEKYCQVVCNDDDPGCDVETSPNTESGRCAATGTGDLCMYYWEEGEREVVCADPEVI